MSDGVYVELDGNGKVLHRFEVQQDPPVTFWPAGSAEYQALQIADLQEKRCDEVDRLHAAKELYGFTYLGKRYELNDKSQGKITALGADAANCINGVTGTEWVPIAFTASDNTPTYFAQPQDFMPFATAAKKAGLALFGRRAVLKAQIRASQDPASIDIEAGWPANV